MKVGSLCGPVQRPMGFEQRLRDLKGNARSTQMFALVAAVRLVGVENRECMGKARGSLGGERRPCLRQMMVGNDQVQS